MALRVVIPDLISPSYFPAIAAVEMGFFKKEGLDATLELVFPVTRAYEELRDGKSDFVGGASHAPLYAFKDWAGAQLLCALAQNMYWFLVVRSDLNAKRGDLQSIRGLRIGAAPGPVDGLRRMLREVGMDPDRDVKIGPVPAAAGVGASFGVAAAKAMEKGDIDGFWANGMGMEVAIRNGTGTLVIDARRGDGPAPAIDYTFPALVATRKTVQERPEIAAAGVRAVIAAQKALREDPERATAIGRKLFPEHEASLIAELVRRDQPYYDPVISEHKVSAMNRFSKEMGILSRDVSYDEIVPASARALWK